MRIVVVGDVMLDVDLAGEATRLSPDAPVPVVDVTGVRRRAGGAGLVARMLAADGRPVTLVTVLSADDAGRQLAAELAGVRLVAGPSEPPVAGQNTGPGRLAPGGPVRPGLRRHAGSGRHAGHAQGRGSRGGGHCRRLRQGPGRQSAAAHLLEQAGREGARHLGPAPRRGGSGARRRSGNAQPRGGQKSRRRSAGRPAGGDWPRDNPGGTRARASAETASGEVAGESAIAGEAARLAHACWTGGAAAPCW